MSQQNEMESKPRRIFLPNKEDPDDMVFHAKSDEERMIIDLTLGLLSSVPCIKGLKVLQQKQGSDPKEEYCMLAVVNLSVKPIPKDSTLPWILSLTIGHGKTGHYKFNINKNYIFTKYSDSCPYDKSHVFAKLAEVNAFLESLKEMEEPNAVRVLKEKYVVTFFPAAPKRSLPSPPTVIVQQQQPATAVEPPTKKVKTNSAVAPAHARASKKKAPAKRTTPRRNPPAKTLPLKSKEEDEPETAVENDAEEESESNQKEEVEKAKDTSFHGSDADGDDDEDDGDA